MKFAISDPASFLGMILGTAGLTLGLLNYFRDRAKLKVTLEWDWKPTGDAKKLWGLVSVTNIGRRPAYIKIATLRVPKGLGDSITLGDSVAGNKLDESDRPITFRIDQDGMEKHGKHWKKLRADVFDSTGKRYSARADKTKTPSWAKKQ